MTADVHTDLYLLLIKTLTLWLYFRSPIHCAFRGWEITEKSVHQHWAFEVNNSNEKIKPSESKTIFWELGSAMAAGLLGKVIGKRGFWSAFRKVDLEN